MFILILLFVLFDFVTDIVFSNFALLSYLVSVDWS